MTGDPTGVEVLDAIVTDLAELGLVEGCINEDGDTAYRLTREGKAVAPRSTTTTDADERTALPVGWLEEGDWTTSAAGSRGGAMGLTRQAARPVRASGASHPRR